MGPVSIDNRVKFGNPSAKLYREIRPDAVLRRHFRLLFLCSLRPEVVSVVISGSIVGQVGVGAPVKLMIIAQSVHERCHSEAVGCGIFDRFLNFGNCQPEVASDVISGMIKQDAGMDVCANFGDSRLKPSEASFSVLFRTSITSDQKYLMTLYPVCL